MCREDSPPTCTFPSFRSGVCVPKSRVVPVLQSCSLVSRHGTIPCSYDLLILSATLVARLLPQTGANAASALPQSAQEPLLPRDAHRHGCAHQRHTLSESVVLTVLGSPSDAPTRKAEYRHLGSLESVPSQCRDAKGDSMTVHMVVALAGPNPPVHKNIW